MNRRALWLAVIAVLLAACGTPVHSQTPTGWVRPDLRPVSQPVVVDGRLVLYVAAAGGLQVVALDPATGQTLWRDAASPGGVTPGLAPYLGGDHSIVTFLRPFGNKEAYTQLVGVNVTTGHVVWRSPAVIFVDWPAPCFDNPRDICTTGSSGGPSLTWHIRASDGVPLDSVVLSSFPSVRSVANGLLDLLPAGGPEMLEGVSAEAVTWTRPLASVFPSPGASTVYGWDFDQVPAAGLYVGTVFGKPAGKAKSAVVAALSKGATAGFRISDGTVAWRDPGSIYACGELLPCPGTMGAGFPPPTMGVRLRITGKFQPGTVPRLPPGGDVVVEGFDLATGKTLWSHDAGPDASLTYQPPPLLGSHLVSLPAPGGGTVALNLATGTHSPVPAGAVAWCQPTVTYRTKVGWRSLDGKTRYFRVGHPALEPCRATGTPVAVPGTVPGFVGTSIDGLAVWSEPSKVLATPRK